MSDSTKCHIWYSFLPRFTFYKVRIIVAMFIKGFHRFTSRVEKSSRVVEQKPKQICQLSQGLREKFRIKKKSLWEEIWLAMPYSTKTIFSTFFGIHVLLCSFSIIQLNNLSGNVSVPNWYKVFTIFQKMGNILQI